MFLAQRILVSSIALVLCSQVMGQPCTSNRYQARVFDSITVTSDIIYGNAPAVTNPYISENVTFNMDLKLDLFEPMGDTLNKRPLVILAFGGGFLLGSKEDEDIQATCDSLARLGYVTASINYRLGMSILISSSAERAVYRGVQDFSAAVRFFKEFANLYRIDTNYIFAGGVSAGSISALQMVFGEETDRPASTFASGFPNSAPDLGCINCSGNSYNHSSTNVKALINCWGATGNVNWMEPGEDVPIVSFHGNLDLIVPYDSGFPFTALATMPYVYGSLPISQRADAIGLYNEFYTFAGEGHNVWGTVVNNSFLGGATVFFQPILHSISDFLFRFITPITEPITGVSTSCVGDTNTYSVANTTGSTYCWTVNGGSIVSTDSSNNSIEVRWDMTGQNDLSVLESNGFLAKGDTETYIIQVNQLPAVTIQELDDTLFVDQGFAYQWYLNDVQLSGETSYFISTVQSGNYTVLVTDSNGCQFKSEVHPYVYAGLLSTKHQNALLLYPNPNQGSFYIQLTCEFGGPGLHISITNMLGETVYQKSFDVCSSTHPHEIDIRAFTKGMYLAALTFDNQRIYRKVFVY
ncbi:MAG: T9SS type A sorting domain-containing protein [Flavobacteriales bacterium]|nr:T9SS type A sorting domain-containing protein [Flavobacteriales bacterium]